VVFIIVVSILPNKSNHKIFTPFLLILARIVTIGLALVIVGAAWDLWWHGIKGFERIFQPSHNVAYLGFALAFFASGYGYYLSRFRHWKLLIVSIILYIPAIVFNSFYHLFLPERDEISDLKLILWEAPHIVTWMALFVTFLLVLTVINKDPNNKFRIYFQSLIFTMMTINLLYFVTPLIFIDSDLLIGLFSYAPIPFVIIGMMLFARTFFKTRWGVFFNGYIIYFNILFFDLFVSASIFFCRTFAFFLFCFCTTHCFFIYYNKFISFKYYYWHFCRIAVDVYRSCINNKDRWLLSNKF